MLVERLDQSDIPRHFNRQWCSQMVTSSYFPKAKPWKCKVTANWTIDGVPYCNRHAGLLALIHMEVQNVR
jgi:hypothetical protein